MKTKKIAFRAFFFSPSKKLIIFIELFAFQSLICTNKQAYLHVPNFTTLTKTDYWKYKDLRIFVVVTDAALGIVISLFTNKQTKQKIQFRDYNMFSNAWN